MTIPANATDPTARLVITANRTATFWMNVVTLRPVRDTFRADLLQKLKDIKPRFMGFPGGTYVQGQDRPSSFCWKKTISDFASRSGHYNAVWSYWSNDYIGFYEYLLLCEKLGAEPYYAAYVGWTWTPPTRSPFGLLDRSRINVSDTPMEEMGPVVQDAPDAIEYANGAADSKWGAIRAKAGHAAPFALEYLEIGNEDKENPLYPERYKLMYAAIKAKYPRMLVLANDRNGNVKAGDLKIEMDGGTSVQGVNATAEVQGDKVTGTAAGYIYTARVRKTSGNGGISVRFAAQDHGGTYLAWYLGVKDRAITEMWGGLGDLNVPVYQPETSFSGPISREVNSTIEIGRWYSVAIHVTGRSVVCALDGKEIHHAPVPETLGPSVHGAADRTPTGSVVIRLVNISQLKQSASIALAGTGTNKYSTVASTLTPADLDAENSLSDPTRIASVEHKLPVVGGNFQFEMEGNSFTVLKLSPEKR